MFPHRWPSVRSQQLDYHRTLAVVDGGTGDWHTSGGVDGGRDGDGRPLTDLMGGSCHLKSQMKHLPLARHPDQTWTTVLNGDGADRGDEVGLRPLLLPPPQLQQLQSLP